MQNRTILSLAAAFALTMAMPAVAQMSSTSQTSQPSANTYIGGGQNYRSSGKTYRYGKKHRGGGRYYKGSGGGGGNVSQYGTPDQIKGLGTYAGDLYAKRFKGNGNYFYYGGQDYFFVPQPQQAPTLAREGAKIIDVQEALNTAQSTEAATGAKIIDVQEALNALQCDEDTGVCLIKP